MKKLCLFAALAAMLLASPAFSVSAAAQQGGVAVIDLSHIFKNHYRFKAMTEDMRNAALRAQDDLKARNAEIEGLQKRLQELGEQLRKDSPEYKQLDADITRRKVDITAQVATQKKEFLEREAKIYYNVYQEVIDAVQFHANRLGVAIVLRHSNEQIEEQDPNGILKKLNQQVVYVNPAVDITQIVLTDLNRSNPGAAAPATSGPPPRTGVPVPSTARPNTGVPRPGVQR